MTFRGRHLHSLFKLLLLFFAASNPALANSFDVLRDWSLGKAAVDYHHSGSFATSSNTVLVDGNVTSLGTDSTTYDRTLANITRIMGTFVMGPRLGLRVGITTSLDIHSEEGAEEPRKISKEVITTAIPEAGFIFFTQNALEIGAGIQYYVQPSYERRSESASIETVWSFSEVTIPIPYITIVKRASAFQGGFYFYQGGEKTRSIRKFTSQDGSELNFDDKVFIPPELALFFQTGIGIMNFFGEFAAVQAGEGGNTTDTGDRVFEDYQRLKLSGFFPIEPGKFSLRSTLIHKTLSYADNRNVSLPTIPMTGLHLHFVNGSDTNNVYVGFIIATGKDGQSLDEFNASYKVNAYGIGAGINLVF